MTNQEAIEILKNEVMCIRIQGSGNPCDRNCAECNLLKTDAELYEAYDLACKALDDPPSSPSSPMLILPDGQRCYLTAGHLDALAKYERQLSAIELTSIMAKNFSEALNEYFISGYDSSESEDQEE